ncbi:MAG: hypothetical protein M4579_004760 [Chaenotheca gracillima]|nr:MAG: hypothetical protein M4579_004760 [Chaenotheca gracillima]
MNLSQLLSPPDCTPRPNFSAARDLTPSKSPLSQSATPAYLLPPIYSPQTRDIMGRLPSPPVTPGTFAARKNDTRRPSSSALAAGISRHGDHDPLLYPATATSNGSHEQPLFPPAPVEPSTTAGPLDSKIDQLVDQHMTMHLAQFRTPASKPTRDEYLLALSCVPVVSKRYAENPNKWLQQERRILDERFSKANRVWKRPSPTTLAKLAPAPPSGDIKKRSPAVRAPRAPRAPRTPKRTPQSKVHDSFDSGISGSPKRVIGTSREDTDFNALPDYCPPLSTLPNNNVKALKADWKGQMLDLSRDPHRDLLHEAELHLAATLRLSCATYLCSKRRIFMARVNAMKMGKEFRKTDSQQACKIDVNKASKLWSAYDKVGWFSPNYFREF